MLLIRGCLHLLDKVTFFGHNAQMTSEGILKLNLCLSAHSIPSLSSIVVRVQICGLKRLSCDAGHQEVSRSHTRGHYEESITHRMMERPSKGIHPDFGTEGRCHQKSQTGVSVAHQKRTDVLPIFFKKSYLSRLFTDARALNYLGFSNLSHLCSQVSAHFRIRLCCCKTRNSCVLKL